MKHNKYITPRNDKHQRHGYWEGYYANGALWYKGTFHNGWLIGYWEWYNRDDGILSYKLYLLI